MRNSRDQGAVQLTLFDQPVRTDKSATLATPERLTPESDLASGRWWYRLYLERHGHPPNTVSAYIHDLVVLESQVRHKPLRHISASDISAYLDSARRKSTRKRRLTSAREFYAYLIREEKLLTSDPTEQFFPERIHLKTPIPLFDSDRKKLMLAAEEDGARSLLMVYLMLNMGINRTELLALRKEHFDLSVPESPVVYVHYDDPRWRHKDRRLQGDAQLTATYTEYAATLPDDRLFPILPQAVNALVHRLARNAGLDRSVTPQTLRDTFGVDQARSGKSEDELLAVLGLASDPRNRDSVRRYIKLAEPPVDVVESTAG